jgi:hypothetical protein
MTKLAKYAALATILGTIFSIYVYYTDGKSSSVLSRIQERVKDGGAHESVQAKDRKQIYYELLIKEIDSLPSSDMNELRARHKAAKEIPLSTDMSDALFDVVKICLKNKQPDYALEVARDIPLSVATSDAYRAIALFLAYNGQFEKAITAAKKIPLSRTESLTLKEISTIKKNPDLSEKKNNNREDK